MPSSKELLDRLNELARKLGYPEYSLKRKSKGILKANIEALERELKEKETDQ